MPKRIFFLSILLFGIGIFFLRKPPITFETMLLSALTDAQEHPTNPLYIEIMRSLAYPGSALLSVTPLPEAETHFRQIISYRSGNLLLYGLLTTPTGQRPPKGWPLVLFTHGYVPPLEFNTEETYHSYINALSREGFMVFMPDYRGHGNSQGNNTADYFSAAYSIDSLQGLSSVITHPDVDPDRIGIWGHSLGGYVALRMMVVDPRIKAGVIWAGAVGSYQEMLKHWTDQEGLYEADFLAKLSPLSYLSELAAPVQIHHGALDTTVPIRFSEQLALTLENLEKEYEFYRYEDGDHLLTEPTFTVAMLRTVDFFKKQLPLH